VGTLRDGRFSFGGAFKAPEFLTVFEAVAAENVCFFAHPVEQEDLVSDHGCSTEPFLEFDVPEDFRAVWGEFFDEAGFLGGTVTLWS